MARKSVAKEAVARMTSTRFRHANCLRCFRRLYEADPGKAAKVYEAARSYLKSYE